MKKLILDEMNIKDIMNPIDLNEALYGTSTTNETFTTNTNIIEVVHDDKTFIDLYKIEDIDMFNNDYVVIAKTDTKMYLKEIPIKNVPEGDSD